jgi:hypothetical protein
MQTRAHREPLICERCDDVIGTYEPTVVVAGSEVRLTSRAAEPALVAGSGLFHLPCYLLAAPREGSQLQAQPTA